jgi:Holliday junction resolvase-like predicted endonuclease
VVARSYRPRSGHSEIDLAAWHGEKLFVELKTRDTADFEERERAVDSEKQSHRLRAARDYARRANLQWQQMRCDVLAIVLAPRRIEWFRDAFH